MLDEVLKELAAPLDIGAVTEGIEAPTMPDISLDVQPKEQAGIFGVGQRKSWDKGEEARCDFASKLRLTPRASLLFVSLWQKSVFGRTLTDIKSDDTMVGFFVEQLVPVIRGVVGTNLHKGSWAIVTTPMRRHRERNFASLISEGLASELGIPFYFDCARCESRQRVDAVFEANNIPSEANVIVFDDFVTTGSTLLAMKNLLQSFGKNCVFFAGINNKL